MIEISINSQQKQFDKELSIAQALEELGYQEQGMLGIAHNKIFVAKDSWDNTLIKHKDELEILKPISGG